MVEVILRLVEHVFAEHAFVVARDGNRAHVMEQARLDFVSKRDCVLGADHVGGVIVVRTR